MGQRPVEGFTTEVTESTEKIVKPQMNADERRCIAHVIDACAIPSAFIC